MAAKKTKTTDKPELAPSIAQVKKILADGLKDNKHDHYNFEDAVDYKISSGSFTLDVHMDGGFGPGLHRFCGINEGGKTSEALEALRNFLQTVPNSKGVLFPTEGRLSPELKERSGLTFVYTAEEWVHGTVFVYESNVYEAVMDLIRALVFKNPEKNKYGFVLDSVDGLIPRGDLDKGLEDSGKVAGGAVIASHLMKKMAIAFTKRGHIGFFLSQIRADIQLDPYKKTVVRQTTATGGNALLHNANWILEFEPRFRDDLILLNPDTKKVDAKDNPIIGHWAKVTVKKSPNEKSQLTLKYPIRYGRTGGKSIWVEKELADLIVMWGFVEKRGSWYAFDPELLGDLGEAGIKDFPEKVQGMNGIFDAVASSPKTISFLVSYFKEKIYHSD